MFALRGMLAVGAVFGLTALAATAPANGGRPRGQAIKRDGAPAVKAIRARPGQSVHNHRAGQHRHFVEGVVVKVHNGRGGKAGPSLAIRVGDPHRQREAGAAARLRKHHHRGEELFAVDGNTRFHRVHNAGTAGQSERPMVFHQVREGDFVKILRGPNGINLALLVDVLEGGRYHRHHRHHRQGIAGGGGGGAPGVPGAPGIPGAPGGAGGNGGFGIGGLGNGMNVGVNVDVDRMRGRRRRGFNEDVNVNVNVAGRRMRKVPMRHSLLASRTGERRQGRPANLQVGGRQQGRGKGSALPPVRLHSLVARHSLIAGGKSARLGRNHPLRRVARLVERRQDRKAAGQPVAHPIKAAEHLAKGVAKEVRHEVAKHAAAKAAPHPTAHDAPHHAAHHAPAPARHGSTAHHAAAGHHKR